MIIKPLYYCHACGKVLDQLDDLLFVEEEGTRGFCSEKCIEDFYAPIVEYLELQENDIRSQYQIEEKQLQKVKSVAGHMQKVLHSPQEIYQLTNQLGESVFCYITSVSDEVRGKFTLAAWCLTYQYRPSFIFSVSVTQEAKLIQLFKQGEQVTDPKYFRPPQTQVNSENEMIEVPDEQLKAVELKKSRYLADLIEKRSDFDIEFEAYHLYEKYFQPTIEGPDEIYQHEDLEGDAIQTFIKAFDKDGSSFFYFIIFYQVMTEKNQAKASLLPILSFPTLDGNLSKQYKRGELISGNLSN